MAALLARRSVPASLTFAALLVAALVPPGGGISPVALYQRGLHPGQRPPTDDEAVRLALAASKAVLSAGRSRSHGQSSADAGSREQRSPGNSADFFGSFYAGESTYNEAGDPSVVRKQDGWDPAVSSPLKGNSNPAAWFHESPSGGPSAAWQTHYPALETGLAGREYKAGKWTNSNGGGWSQTPHTGYDDESTTADGGDLNMARGTKKLEAAWFDMAAVQPDGFGRPPAPGVTDPRHYIDNGWQERTVNTTVSCKEPGCLAAGKLQLFSGSTEKARMCRMSLYVEHHSGGLPWITVNGANVSFECTPPASKCGDEEPGPRAMYPCIFDLNLAKLVTQTGTLDVAAKLSDDASANCTHEGDLLRAVPTVSCLVAGLARPGAGANISSGAVLPETEGDEEGEAAEEETAAKQLSPGPAANATAAGGAATAAAGTSRAEAQPPAAARGHFDAASAEALRAVANASAAAAAAARQGLAVAEPSVLGARSTAAEAAEAAAAGSESEAADLGAALAVNASDLEGSDMDEEEPTVPGFNATVRGADRRQLTSTTVPPPEPWVLGSASTAGTAARDALGLPAASTTEIAASVAHAAAAAATTTAEPGSSTQ